MVDVAWPGDAVVALDVLVHCGDESCICVSGAAVGADRVAFHVGVVGAVDHHRPFRDVARRVVRPGTGDAIIREGGVGSAVRRPRLHHDA